MEDERKLGEPGRGDEAAPAANIAASVFLDLRRQILSGRLAAGERLPGERELAQHYGTNRNTLREAVRRLEQAKLVTVRHGQGVTVSNFRRTGTLELLSTFLETSPDSREIAQMLEDLLPARLQVIEFAARLAVRRAERTDVERLRDLTELLISAFAGRDPKVVAHGFHQWLDALIDAGHSVAIRWIANPFLEAYRDLLDRFPFLWVLDPSFPEHLKDFMAALEAADEARAIEVTRRYYEGIDGPLMRMLEAMLALRGGLGGAATNLPASAPTAPTEAED
jgi:DNA-binding FadR family transcriptional regulator